MGISLSDLSPKAREQVAAKLAIEQVKRAKQVQQPKPSKQSKYHAEKVETTLEDGTPFTFASRKEYQRYQHLLMLKRCGEISDLRVQVKYQLVPSQKLSDGKRMRGIDYIADFVYRDKDGNERVEDVKGYRDSASAAYRVFKLKAKLMKFFHNIEIAEV